MNGYLLGIALIMAWLGLQAVGAHVRHKNLMKACSAFTDMLGALAKMPEEQIREGREQWDRARVNAEISLAVSSCVFLAALIFLVVLVVRGHL